MSLRLVRRPKTPYWVIRGSIRRIRVEESTGTDDKKIAEQIRAKREAELLAESIYGPRATATFAQAALSYLEGGGSRRYLHKIIEHFGTTPLTHIDQSAIDRGARQLYPEVSNSTRVRHFYGPVSAVLRHAARRGWCSTPIIERPRTPKPRVRSLTLDEANRLIDVCAHHLRPLVIFLIYTGARAGEALWLDWRHVDLDRRHVSFPKTKNGDARGVPLPRRVIDALARLPHRKGAVFRRPDGMPYDRPGDDDENRSAGSRIKTAFRGACRRAGITDLHPHDLRHVFATWHYAANHDLTALMNVGGWKNIKSVMRYTHANVEEFQSTMDRLPGGNLGASNAPKPKIPNKSTA
jgi:integrase